MSVHQAILLLQLLGSALALEARATSLQWGPCLTLNNQPVPVSCATLSVPRDYLANSSATITLNLVKLSAAKQPSKGTVLYNPGGPGDGGRNAVVTSAVTLHEHVSPGIVMRRCRVLTSSQAQLVHIMTSSRGILGGVLTPDCFPNTVNRTAYDLQLPLASNASDVSLEIAWAIKTTYMQSCAENEKGVGELIGTAYTVRDMMNIVDALGEDGLLRYYGQSYGTLLGQTAAAMFPDRVDRIVVDGVLNPTQYYNGRSVEQFDVTDAVFEGFLAQCIGSPNICPVARYDRPDLGLSQQVYATLEVLKTQPILNYPYAGNLLDYGAAKDLIVQNIYGLGYGWINMGIALDLLLSRNISVASDLIPTNNKTAPSPFPGDSPDAPQAIRCSDTSLRVNSLDEIRSLIGEFYQQSRLVGDYISVLYPMDCTQWPFKAKEVYSGGFNKIMTKHPILFVGNTFDPITSLAGARNASAGFPGSRLLVQNGYGHSSWGQYSSCTNEVINRYFLDGTLPEENTQCQPDVGLFASNMLTGTRT